MLFENASIVQSAALKANGYLSSDLGMVSNIEEKMVQSNLLWKKQEKEIDFIKTKIRARDREAKVIRDSLNDLRKSSKVSS